MKKLKALVVVIITIFTLASVMYLIYHAEKIDRYTLAVNDGRTCFVVYSSSGGTINGEETIDNVLSYVESFASQVGYDSINLGIKKGIDEETLRKEIMDSMKQDKKYILLDINATGIVINKNTIIIRVSSKTNDKYSENLEFANSIKETVTDKTLKANIIPDKNKAYNQDLGYRALYLDISNKNTLSETKEIISNVLGTLVK
jgi:hypothetical protein